MYKLMYKPLIINHKLIYQPLIINHKLIYKPLIINHYITSCKFINYELLYKSIYKSLVYK